jgi:hypothetical protein
MILAFSRDSLVKSIINGNKTQAIIPDSQNKWVEGETIQFWSGNPPLTDKYPLMFAECICVAVEPIYIFSSINLVVIHASEPKVIVNIRALNKFAQDEGLNSWDEMKAIYPENFSGKIVYWNPEKCKFTN